MKFLYENYTIIISEGLTCNEGQVIFRNGTQVDADGWCCHFLERDSKKIKFGDYIYKIKKGLCNLIYNSNA